MGEDAGGWGIVPAMFAIVGCGKAALPLRGFPEGKARIRQRADDIVTVSIRPPGGGIRRFVVTERDGCWWPAGELGANINVKNERTQ